MSTEIIQKQRLITTQAMPTTTTTGWSCEIVLVRHGETDWNLERRLQGSMKPGPSLNATGMRQAAAVGKLVAGMDVAAVIRSPLLRCIETVEIIQRQSNQTKETYVVEECEDLKERCLGPLFEGRVLTVDVAQALRRCANSFSCASTSCGNGQGTMSTVGHITSNVQSHGRAQRHGQIADSGQDSWILPDDEELHPGKGCQKRASVEHRKHHQHTTDQIALGTAVESIEHVKERVYKALNTIAKKHRGKKVVVVTHGGVLTSIYARIRPHERPIAMNNCGISKLLVVYRNGRMHWDILGDWNDCNHLVCPSLCVKADGSFGGGSFG